MFFTSFTSEIEKKATLAETGAAAQVHANAIKEDLSKRLKAGVKRGVAEGIPFLALSGVVGAKGGIVARNFARSGKSFADIATKMSKGQTGLGKVVNEHFLKSVGQAADASAKRYKNMSLGRAAWEGAKTPYRIFGPKETFAVGSLAAVPGFTRGFLNKKEK